MRHLPIFLELGGKAAIVVGGGAVAARRAEHLDQGRRSRDDIRACAQRRFSRASRCAELSPRGARSRAPGFRGRRGLLRGARGRALVSRGLGGGKGGRRMGERRRPAAVLRLHHARDYRPRPACHRDFDRRGFADSGPHAEGPPGKRHSRRLRPPCRPHGRIPRRGGQGDRLSDPAAPILGDGARGTDRGTGALRRRARRGRRTHSRHRTRGAPRTPRRRAARSISSARGPAIPIF